MKTNYFDELKSACQNSNPASEEKIIENGNTIWFAGNPVYSSEGTIALETASNQTVVINEKDIITVEKNDNLYLVEVKGYANFLYRLDIVSKAVKSKECGCDKDKHEIIAKQRGSSGPFNTSVCAPVCEIYLECTWIVDSRGYVREVCFPYPVCKSPCI